MSPIFKILGDGIILYNEEKNLAVNLADSGRLSVNKAGSARISTPVIEAYFA